MVARIGTRCASPLMWRLLGAAGRRRRLGEAGGQLGDRPWVPVVLEEFEALEPKTGGDVGPDEGLAGVVENPEDIAWVHEEDQVDDHEQDDDDQDQDIDEARDYMLVREDRPTES